jgi:hypothetical protein
MATATVNKPVIKKVQQKFQPSIELIMLMLGFASFFKAYAKEAAKIHNSVIKDSPKSERQIQSGKDKVRLHNDLSRAKKQYNLALSLYENDSCQEHELLLREALTEQAKAEVAHAAIVKEREDIIERAKAQYKLILQSNWIFATIHELLKTHTELQKISKKGHCLDAGGHPQLIIQIGDEQISCPQGFTLLDLDKDGYKDVIEHIPTEAGVYYQGVKDIQDFPIELKVLIHECMGKYLDPIKNK